MRHAVYNNNEYYSSTQVTQYYCSRAIDYCLQTEYGFILSKG